MRREFQPGEHVEWNTPQGKTSGKIKRKLTSTTWVKRHKVATSPEHPEYLVQSTLSGDLAAHRPEALAPHRLTAEQRSIVHAFREAVNMSPSAIERWLRTEESRAVGQKKSPGSESVGHASGREIVRLLRTRQAELTAADFAHMRKVTGYVHRHMAQRPAGDIRHTRWRYSLMNWGHDPLKPMKRH